ncbi:MAG TPA: hypothetical protein VJN43_22360 [Bryobacteraceae bacterium]|nr:hypothetical protein [Bryobacteraceae bacterium]
MNSKLHSLATCFLLFAAPLFCQSGGIILTAGYTNPIPLRLSPGQVVTLYVAGIGPLAKSVSATGLPLPLTLGGISVSMIQTYGPFGPFAVPLIHAVPFSTCLSTGFGTVPCAEGAAITVQIPFELIPNIPGQLGPPNVARLTASDGTATSTAIDINPVPDQIHVLNGDDALFIDSVSGGPMVTHANGTLVTTTAPATAGEELVMYLVGLGSTNPAVPTGAASPRVAPITPNPPPLIGFDFRPNAVPMRPLPGSASPIFSGLTPGGVGLYQVNFVVPPVPAGTATCTQTGSNLTVTVAGITSFDGAAICVATQH